MLRHSIWLLVWLVILQSGRVVGQNLVPNGSFERYQNCPRKDNLLEEAIPWYNPNRATPDFYHQCFQTGQMLLPPHSGQGVGRLFFDQGWAEYMAVQLTKPLSASTCYYFEMYVATDTPNKYITETMGAYLSAQPITALTNTDLLGIGPQILDNLPKAGIANLQWQRISGFLNAKGGEQYLTIGSFYKLPGFLGFYYLFLDDISLVPVTLDLGKDTTLCGRRSTYRLDATTPGADYYRWSDRSTEPTLLVTKPGTYAVTAITTCKTLTDSITVDYALDFNLGADTTLCRGQTLALSVPPAAAATYRWQDGSARNQYTVSQAGQYSVRVVQAGCVVGDSIQVRYVLPPQLDLGPDKELCGAERVTIQPVVAEGKFSWQDAFPGVERTVNSFGVFRASVRNDCATVTDSVVIDYGACDCLIYAPNSFTPNEDGQNDTFAPFGCGNSVITSLTIFNRWGEPVFQTSQPPFQWDGHYRGAICPTGVYAWSLQYGVNQRGRLTPGQKQGAVSLVR